jgi:hypothetical protein
MTRRLLVQSVAAATATSLLSCGYHVGGKGDLVPKSVDTIAIPAFSTVTSRYKIVDELPLYISREFMARTRFHMVNDPSQADATLNGSILAVSVYPTISDPTTGRVTSIRIVLRITVNLIEKSTAHVLFSRPNWQLHQDYASAVDPHQYFDESGPAFDRLCRDIAHDLVSGVVENF